MTDHETRITALEERTAAHGERMKETVKEAIKEWLNEMVAQVGWWSLRTFVALVIAALAYLILWANGWRLPQ